jgi:hypothetical protein
MCDRIMRDRRPGRSYCRRSRTDLALRVVETDLRAAGRIGRVAVERAGQQSVFQRQQCDHRFDDAGRAQGVSGPALGRTGVQAVREQTGDRVRLDRIVRRRGGAVQIEITHFAGVDAGARQRIAHRQVRA